MPARPVLKAIAAASLTFGLLLLAANADLSAGPSPKEAARYTADLKSKDAKVRATALTELGKMGQIQKALVKDAMPDMFKLLEDKEATVRVAAARALGMVDPDPKEAVPALVKLLKEDKDDSVKIAAVQGLGAMGEAAKDSVKDLRDVIKTEDMKSKLSKAAKISLKTISPKMKKN